MDDFVQAMQLTLVEIPHMGPSESGPGGLEIAIADAEQCHRELSEVQRRRVDDAWQRFLSVVQQQNQIHSAAQRLYRDVEKRLVRAQAVQGRKPPVTLARHGPLMMQLAALLSQLSNDELSELLDVAVASAAR